MLLGDYFGQNLYKGHTSAIFMLCSENKKKIACRFVQLTE